MELEKLIEKSKGFEVENITADTKSYIKRIGDIEFKVIRELDKASEKKYLIPLVVFDDSEVFVLYNPLGDNRFSYSLNYAQKKAIHNLKDIEGGIPTLRFEKETRKSGECIIEYPEGTLLSEYQSFYDKVPSDFFDQLSGLVKKIHNRGVANIGLDKQHTLLLSRFRHEPLFLGFENSVSKDDKFFGWLYDLAQRTDWYNLLRLKHGLRPEQLESSELRGLEKGLDNNPPFKKLQSQFKINQFVNIWKTNTQNPYLSYASFLIESMIKSYPSGERILHG